MTGGARTLLRFGTGMVAATWVATAPTTGWSAPLPSGRVALLDAPEASPIARHCLTRIREELTSDGFRVTLVDPGPRADPPSIVAVMRAQEGAVATIALLGDPSRPGAELWILDRIGTAAEVRRIPIPADDPDHLPEVLAIRTAELLRASALKALLEATAPRPEAAPVVASPPRVDPALTPTTHAVGVEAGISMIESVRGPGPAALPLGRVRIRLGDSLFVRLTLAGLGSRPQIETSIGSASVAQSFGLAELALVLRPKARWRPTFDVGGGALYVRSDGQGLWPYAGLERTGWAALVGAGGGVLVSVASALSLSFEIHALMAFPHPMVRFYDQEGATLAFPAVLASLTIVAWL
jgi:hypothetical protein